MISHSILSKTFGCIVAALALSSQSARADFSGPYAPANWTFEPNFPNPGDGSVDTSNAPLSITLTGNNNGNSSVNTTYLIEAVASGMWSFDWEYSSTDIGEYDVAAYQINGGFFQFVSNDTQGSGSLSVFVNAGDIIGFNVFSSDGSFGPGVLEISNFNAPIPAPGALALLGIAAIIGPHRRRRT